MIPLTVEIPASERDPDLPNKLRAEWPGILAWAVRGCRKWQAEGLAQPTAVRSATTAWQEETDHLKAFVDRELIISPGSKIPASKLFDLYTRESYRE